MWASEILKQSQTRWLVGTWVPHSIPAEQIISTHHFPCWSLKTGDFAFMASIWSRLVMTLGPFAPSSRPWTHPAFAKALGRVSRECSQRKKWPSPPREHILHRLSVHYQAHESCDPIQIVVSEHRDTWSLIDDDHGILKYPRSQGKPK